MEKGGGEEVKIFLIKKSKVDWERGRWSSDMERIERNK